MSTDEIAILMSAATAYAGSVSSIFNMFLAVVFGTLAFSAAISLRHIGKNCGSERFHISLSSLIIGLVLIAFFIISFISFRRAAVALRHILAELHAQTSGWKFSNEKAHEAFSSVDTLIMGLGVPELGYIIGSVGTILAFFWISNTKRD